MKERDQFRLDELRRQVWEEQGGVCFLCGARPMTQLAHVLPQGAYTEQWLRNRYPDIRPVLIIQHRENVRGVCGLACNKAVDTGTESDHVKIVHVERILAARAREASAQLVGV